MYTEQRFYVTTSNRSRLALWDRLFHADRLPVKSPHARLTPGLNMAYRLDAAALTENQVNALTGWLVWCNYMSPDNAAALVREGFPIAANEVELIAEQGQGYRYLAPVFVSPGRAVQSRLFLC